MRHRYSRRHFLLTAGCSLAGFAGSAIARPTRAHPLRQVPPAYRQAANRAGIPPRLLYGIAMQESAMLWGDSVLPWLWTLNVAGAPHRYASYEDSVRALTHCVTVRGIRNVDCGPMQVNWRWHSDKLLTFRNALDAHHNLAVGAALIAQHYRDSNDWFVAAGRYHHPTDIPRARTYANGVWRRIAQLEDA